MAFLGYTITYSEILSIMKFIDLFCGCGGLSEGFRLAGYDCVAGIDNNAAAIKTFKRNFPEAKALCKDLLSVDSEQILKELGPLDDIDVIIGGPPCQGFSSANRYKNETADPRNKLFFQFVKFVDIAKPKVVLIENVRGIITSDNGYAKDRIYEIFQERGYKVNHQILDASEYGVPQKRLRNFFVIVRKDAFDFSLVEKSSKKTTVKEAIGELYELNSPGNEGALIDYPVDAKTDYQKYLRKGSLGLMNHDVRYPAEKVQERISFVPQGGNWRDVPNHLWPTDRDNRHSSAYKRLCEEDVSCTIDTGNNHSNYFHPLYNRLPTVREAARLQSFPDSFIFEGNRSEQYRQVGNAVPPMLARQIALAIKKVIDEE